MAKEIMPKNSKKAQLVAKIIVVSLIIYVIAAFTAGSIMLVEGFGSKAVAIILVVSSIIIFLSQIVLGTIHYSKKK